MHFTSNRPWECNSGCQLSNSDWVPGGSSGCSWALELKTQSAQVHASPCCHRRKQNCGCGALVARWSLIVQATPHPCRKMIFFYCSLELGDLLAPLAALGHKVPFLRNHPRPSSFVCSLGTVGGRFGSNWSLWMLLLSSAYWSSVGTGWSGDSNDSFISSSAVAPL